jgi:tRNA-Thr(GGU) m(6)t(6)A37 methyltransferase TsaA
MPMKNKPDELILKPIGRVRSPVTERPAADFAWDDIVSDITLDDSLKEGLDGLEEYSHVIVIYWLHKSVEPERMALKVHPRRKTDKEPVGLFASRSPFRPNPLAMKVVQLLERRGNVLSVRGLDAIDGTPVLDIKPFIPGYDSPAGSTAPKWMSSR